MDWYRLKSIGLKRETIKQLMNFKSEYEEILKIDSERLKTDFRLNEQEIQRIKNSKNCREYEEDILKLEKQDIKVISMNSLEYPETLRNISDPPIFLYYRGDISLIKNTVLSIVGTRKATSYGIEFTKKIAKEMALADITIASGMAMGIDIVAQRVALENRGKVIGIAATGLDIRYPWENRREIERIEKEGVVISEFPPGTEPFKYNFPMRNRVIVGISKGIVVVESGEKGGSLITASIAIDEGRDVFALPGDIYSPYSKGCNNLIKASEAKLITSSQDIFEEYGWKYKNKEEKKNIDLSDNALAIYNALKVSMNLDELIISTGLEGKKILSNLVELEIKGYVMSISGGRYKRKV